LFSAIRVICKKEAKNGKIFPGRERQNSPVTGKSRADQRGRVQYGYCTATKNLTIGSEVLRLDSVLTHQSLEALPFESRQAGSLAYVASGFGQKIFYVFFGKSAQKLFFGLMIWFIKIF
jgi:hypothetical protein